MTVRRFVWLVGWIVVALILISLLFVLWNTTSDTEGHVTGMAGALSGLVILHF
jgi:hypothetical protein